MMRALIALLSLALTQNPGPSVTGAGRLPPACNPPTMTYRWTPTSGCSVATTCATDQVAGNNATQTTLGDVPTYGATCGPNSTPCLTFNGTSDYLALATPIPSGLTTLTLYAVINLTTSQVNSIFGGAGSGLIFRINSSNNPDLESSGVVGVSGSQTLSLSTWYTEVVTYNNGTTTTNFYYASGGSLNAAGSVSQAFSWSGNVPYLANDNYNEVFAGKIAEWGYLNSVNTAGIANWSSCHYGV